MGYRFRAARGAIHVKQIRILFIVIIYLSANNLQAYIHVCVYCMPRSTISYTPLLRAYPHSGSSMSSLFSERESRVAWCASWNRKLSRQLCYIIDLSQA